jgi:hypothetical protein
MLARHDPDASFAIGAAFTAFAAAFVVLTTALCRPLFTPGR